MTYHQPLWMLQSDDDLEDFIELESSCIRCGKLIADHERICTECKQTTKEILEKKRTNKNEKNS